MTQDSQCDSHRVTDHRGTAEQEVRQISYGVSRS